MLKLSINEIIKSRGIIRPYTFLKKHGFSNHKIRLYQTGEPKLISIKDIEHLCEIFNCTPNDIFNYKPDASSSISEEHPLHKLVKMPVVNLAKITTDMNTEELVKAFYTEKQDFLKEYLSENPESEVGQLIKSLNLTKEQKTMLRELDNTLIEGSERHSPEQHGWGDKSTSFLDSVKDWLTGDKKP